MQRAELYGTSVEHLLDVDMLEKKFKEFVLPIIKKEPELFDQKVCTIDNFKLVSSVITSRGFQTKDGLGPFIVS